MSQISSRWNAILCEIGDLLTEPSPRSVGSSSVDLRLSDIAVWFKNCKFLDPSPRRINRRWDPSRFWISQVGFPLQNLRLDAIHVASAINHAIWSLGWRWLYWYGMVALREWGLWYDVSSELFGDRVLDRLRCLLHVDVTFLSGRHMSVNSIRSTVTG